jgi:hypothetical protein
MLTKKYFIEFARIVKNMKHVQRDSETLRLWLAIQFVNMAKKNNPNFDSARFLSDCELDLDIDLDIENV